jgi:hypothetical protein
MYTSLMTFYMSKCVVGKEVTNNYLLLIVQFVDQILYNQSITQNVNYMIFVCSIFLLHLVLVSATYIHFSLSPHIYMLQHFTAGSASILCNVINCIVRLGMTRLLAVWPKNHGSIPGRSEIFLFSKCPDWLWGPPSGYQGLVHWGVKWLGCEAENSPPSNTEVTNGWSYISAPSYVLMAWYVIKYRDNFTCCTI